MTLAYREDSRRILIVKTAFASAGEMLAYYRQQIDQAALVARECNNDVDRNIWLRIAADWRALHDALERDAARPPVIHPASKLSP